MREEFYGQKIRGARPASFCSIFIETFCKNTAGELKRIGRGTGFFYRAASQTFLVTNWHVVTGRNPDTPAQLLPGYPQSPTHFQIHLSGTENKTSFRQLPLWSLYKNGPNWIESPLGPSVDIVAIPLNLMGPIHVVHVQDFASGTGTALEPGIDVAVVGYPFDRSKTNPFPIWKRAMVASEPGYMFEGKPYVLLDTPGRPGMSGSPVYYISSGMLASPESVDLIRKFEEKKISGLDVIQGLDEEIFSERTACLEFAGIYSGSYGDGAMDQLNLGRFWPRFQVDRLFVEGVRGSIPLPPEEDDA